jgi:hypothetical protein
LANIGCTTNSSAALTKIAAVNAAVSARWRARSAGSPAPTGESGMVMGKL